MECRFKHGDRVIAISRDRHIQKGDTGTVIENDSGCPYVSWDEYNENNYEKLGYSNVWSRMDDELELYKGRVSNPQYEIY